MRSIENQEGYRQVPNIENHSDFQFGTERYDQIKIYDTLFGLLDQLHIIFRDFIVKLHTGHARFRNVNHDIIFLNSLSSILQIIIAISKIIVPNGFHEILYCSREIWDDMKAAIEYVEKFV